MDEIPSFYLKQLQSRVGGIAYQLVRLQCSVFCPAETWQPAVNVYRYGKAFHIYVELAGVPSGGVKVEIDRQRIVIRGSRQIGSSGKREETPQQILALEIDEGPFEREIVLPEAINPKATVARHQDGLLVIDAPIAKSR
jgi:HSP20 family protein